LRQNQKTVGSESAGSKADLDGSLVLWFSGAQVRFKENPRTLRTLRTLRT
jgi:hypothetical protein